jgi:hypothetical protein
MKPTDKNENRMVKGEKHDEGKNKNKDESTKMRWCRVDISSHQEEVE